MANRVGRRESVPSPLRWLVCVLVIGGVLAGSMTCAAGLSGALDTLVQAERQTNSQEVGVDAHANHRSPADDRSETPSDAPHHSAEAHPGMACVVVIDLTPPTITATATAIDVATPDSMRCGRSHEPEPPVPKISSSAS